MTERKPGGVSFETWIDTQIREAQERGEFDNLPGKGRPIKGIDQPYDELWWVKQLMVREAVSFTPPTLALRKTVEDLYEGIAKVPSEEAVRQIAAELNARIREVNRKPTEGPPSTLMPLDVERLVERWRAAR